MPLRAWAKALDGFPRTEAYDQAEDALYAVVRLAFQSGWDASVRIGAPCEALTGEKRSPQTKNFR